MSKHTPGPWKYRQAIEGGNTRPFDRYHIFAVSPDNFDNNFGINTGGKLTCLADVRATASKSCTEANARLIAAAPEMLEALEELLFTMTRCGYPAEASAIQKAQEVIKKAKGE